MKDLMLTLALPVILSVVGFTSGNPFVGIVWAAVTIFAIYQLNKDRRYRP